MASTIITKNGQSAGVAPSSLVEGELANNTGDGALFYGSSGGTSVSSSFKFGAISASHVSTSNGNIYAGRFFQGNTNIASIYAPVEGGTGITTVGTVETGTWNATAIATAYIANDAINGNKIADDAIDSEHYTDASIDTAHIADDQITYAKIQNVSATDRILGRDSAGAGVIEEITPANLRTMINVADGATANAGDVTLAGDQTFSGKKTFSAAITASSNISASGDIIATGTLRAKQIQIISANWKGSYGTDETWIPLSAQPEEKTAFANEQTLLLMPTSGHVKEIIIRTHMGTAGSNNVVYKVYIREKNKKVNGSTQSGGDITVTAPTQATNNNTNTVTTGDLGTSHPYSQYDMLGISMAFDAVGTAAGSDKIYITVVLENNLNDLAY